MGAYLEGFFGGGKGGSFKVYKGTVKGLDVQTISIANPFGSAEKVKFLMIMNPATSWLSGGYTHEIICSRGNFTRIVWDRTYMRIADTKESDHITVTDTTITFTTKTMTAYFGYTYDWFVGGEE